MKSDYTEGMDMGQFQHIEDISTYNNNYYTGLNGDVLYRVSDDNYTEDVWFIVDDEEFSYTRIGISYIEDDDKLQLD